MTSPQLDRLDGLSSSTAIKGPCRVVSTANITLSGLQTIDGIALADDDRVLVTGQTDGTLNGIWVADTGAWRRSKDFNKTRDIRSGTQIFVRSGTLYASSGWYVSTADPIVVGTTSIAFTQNVLINAAQLAALEAAAAASADAAAGSEDAADESADRAQGYAALLGAALGPLHFATITTCVADTVLSYTAGVGKVQVGAGDIVEAQGFRFQVAASGATDHSLATAGGAKLYALLGPDGSVAVEQFGAVGDGSHDDTTAFQKMQTWAIARGSAFVKLAQGKTYTYTNPRWPFNIPQLKMEGYGATLRNTNNTSALAIDRYPLITQPGLDQNAVTPGMAWTGGVDHYLINTTTLGATTFTCTTAAEAGQFTAGDWIFLSAFEVFDGNPRAWRNFQYAKVVSVNAGTGVVTIDRPLTSEFSANLADLITAVGSGLAALLSAARVWKLEQAAKWGVKHVYEGINFTSTLAGSASFVLVGGEEMIFRNCTANNFAPSVVEYCRLENCETLVALEGDKNVRHLHILGGIIRGLSQCSGVDSLTLERVNLISTTSWVAPHRLRLIDTDALPTNAFPLAAKRLESIEVVGGRLNSLHSLGANLNARRGSDSPRVTIGTNGVTLTDNNILVVPFTSALATTVRDFLAHATPGATIREVVLVSGNYLCTGTYGIVRSHTAVSGDPTKAQLTIDMNGVVGATSILAFYRTPDISMRNVTFGNSARPITFGPEIAHGQKISARRTLVSTQYPIQGAGLFVDGVPKRIYVNVIRACSSASTLTISRTYPGATTTIAQVALATAGIREVTQSGFSGNLSTDTNFGAALSRASSEYTSKVDIAFSGYGLGLASHQWAVIDFDIEFDFTSANG
ncbi:hypothetical protein NKH72_24190 [Mesorhizobium sp. M0955]|uniref:hypothetical protein n=1 Tax=Mesorhizobium sp. M0955 TaxID=2957033 RepID=UPI00333733E0